MSLPSDHKVPAGAGTLYVIATPIGNLEDITLRALRILKEVDLVASEDTRHTQKLLNHFQIKKKLLSYFRHNESSRSCVIIQHLLEGRKVALVSDAGVPCIADPGYTLVNKAHENFINVVTIPGPSAVVSAISVAGLPADQFLFLGFLPSRSSQRCKFLQPLIMNTNLMIFYESPRRLIKTLKDCLDVFGDRFVVVCKELTKIHEKCFRGHLSHLIDDLGKISPLKGEYVVLVQGRAEKVPVFDDLGKTLVWYRDHSGLSMKDSVKKISSDLGSSRSTVYTEALSVWGKVR